MVAASGGDSRDTRLRRCCDAALLDGGIACMAGTRRDADRACYHVHDPPGVLHLRYARNIFVDSGRRRKSVPPALDTQRHLVPTGRASVLRNRSHGGDAAVVDCGRRGGMRILRGGAVVVEPRGRTR